MQIAVLEGYRVPRGEKKMARHRKSSMRMKMKRCAKSHRVATKGFWACVRAGARRRHRR